MDAEFPFQQLANILRRRRGIIFAMTAFGAALAGLVGPLIPPQYSAKALIVIDPASTDLAGKQAIAPQSSDEVTVQTHVTAIQSDDHLRRTIASLAQDPRLNATVPRPLERFREALLEWWPKLTALLTQRREATATSGDSQRPTVPTQGPLDSMKSKIGALNLDDFRRHLTVGPERVSLAIGITFRSTDPEKAAAVANRMAELYIESQAEHKRARESRALSWLDARLPELGNNAARADAAVQEYRITHRLADANRTDIVDQELGNLGRKLTEAQANLAAQKARLTYFRDLRQRGAGVDSIVRSLDSPVLNELHREELMLLQSEAAITAVLGEKHPKMLQLRNQLQELRRKMEREIGRELDEVVQHLNNDAHIADAQVRSVQQQLATVQGASRRIQEDEVRLHELEREAAAKRERYANALERENEIREQQGLSVPSVRLLSRASTPDRPSSPSPILFVPLTMVVFLITGSFLALILDRLDQRLRSERDINEALGIPCIALVPQLRKNGRTRPHQYLLENPFAAYTEAIRMVVAAVQLAGPGRAPKVILVSSSVPGEGKTTLAVSLAVYAALLGRRVLLVDFDFRHPSIPREVGGKAETGAVDLLLHGRAPSEVVQRAPDLQLDYLPVPRWAGDPLTPFACERMPGLLREMRGNYECVIIDSAPLLAMAETQLLAPLVDTVLFAVKWGSTKRDVAQSALGMLNGDALLGRDRLHRAGAVVTQVNLKKHVRYRYGGIGESLAKHPKYQAHRQKTTDRDMHNFRPKPSER